MKISKESMLGELVAENYGTASVFKSYGIDFCCNGNRSLGNVCEKENIDFNKIAADLDQQTKQKGQEDINYQSWDIDLLVDYIEKKHHRYVEKRIPELKAYLNKIATVHGDRHPELLEIEALFTASAKELLAHMKKEETILFPYVRAMAENKVAQKPVFGTVQSPIGMMMHEHDNEGSRFRKIAELSDNYTLPEDGCSTYQVAFSFLKEFEDDLHLHIHLENNIVFPKAIAMENRLSFTAN